MIFAHGKNDGLRFTIVRPFNVIGPLIDHVMTDAEDGAPRVFAYFMSALLNGEPLKLVDGGKALRTFIHVEDLVEALVTLLENPNEAEGQIFNIGAPQNEIEISDLAALMRDIYNEAFNGGTNRSELIYVDGQEFYGKGFEDTERRMPNIDKLSKLGWAPKISLRELLEDTMKYTFDNRQRLTQEAMDALE